ncbi:MAG: hypothetical protein QXU69_11420 [Thermofilaceae archaeon]
MLAKSEWARSPSSGGYGRYEEHGSEGSALGSCRGTEEEGAGLRARIARCAGRCCLAG